MTSKYDPKINIGHHTSSNQAGVEEFGLSEEEVAKTEKLDRSTLLAMFRAHAAHAAAKGSAMSRAVDLRSSGALPTSQTKGLPAVALAKLTRVQPIVDHSRTIQRVLCVALVAAALAMMVTILTNL
ncbi:MAG: hypothetical protein AAFX99_22050 [Myxococcota bacterium]